MLGALTLEKDDYRLGNTKVFFKVGVMGTLEDWRDERLARIITLFQAHIRGSILRKSYQKLCDQRYVNVTSEDAHIYCVHLFCPKTYLFWSDDDLHLTFVTMCSADVFLTKIFRAITGVRQYNYNVTRLTT